jgi:hypothetical protein
MAEEDDGKISILGHAINRFSDILQLKRLHAKIADIEAHLGDLDADADGVVIILSSHPSIYRLLFAHPLSLSLALR